MKRPAAVVAASLACLASAPLAFAAGPFLYQPITPCRLLDTRQPNGPYGGPALGAGTTRTFAVSTRCTEVPRRASAAYVTVTALDATASGHLRLYQGDAAQPATSNVSFRTGTTAVSNGGLVSLSGKTDASIAIHAALEAPGSVHVAVDVLGWYGSASNTSSRLSFYAVAPCRLADTRSADGPGAGGALVDGEFRRFPAAGHCGIPPDAVALALTATMVGPTGNGQFTMAGAATSVSFVANAGARGAPAIAALDPTDQSVVAAASVAGNGTVHAILDVTGYYKE